MRWFSRKVEAITQLDTIPTVPFVAESDRLWVRSETPAGVRRYMKQFRPQVPDDNMRSRSGNSCMDIFDDVFNSIDKVNRYILDNDQLTILTGLLKTEFPQTFQRFHENSEDDYGEAVAILKIDFLSMRAKVIPFPTLVNWESHSYPVSGDLHSFLELISKASMAASSPEEEYAVERAVSQDLPEIFNAMEKHLHSGTKIRMEVSEVLEEQIALMKVPLQRILDGQESLSLKDMKTHLEYLKERNNLRRPSQLTLND